MLRASTPRYWPWEPGWWKPGKGNSYADRVRELVKAGALIAAEIDRLQMVGPVITRIMEP